MAPIDEKRPFAAAVAAAATATATTTAILPSRVADARAGGIRTQLVDARASLSALPLPIALSLAIACTALA